MGSDWGLYLEVEVAGARNVRQSVYESGRVDESRAPFGVVSRFLCS